MEGSVIPIEARAARAALVRTPRFRFSSSTAPRRSGKSSPAQVPSVVVGVAIHAILLLHGGCAQCESLLRAKPLCFRSCSEALVAVCHLVPPVVRSPMCSGAVPICHGWLYRRHSPRRLQSGSSASSLAVPAVSPLASWGWSWASPVG